MFEGRIVASGGPSSPTSSRASGYEDIARAPPAGDATVPPRHVAAAPPHGHP
jgi:hypothetical protein